MIDEVENGSVASVSNQNQKKVVIAGYFGFDNTGDEAILDVTLDRLRSSLPNPKIFVISGNPEETSVRHKVESVQHTNISEIFNAVQTCDLVIMGGGGLFHDYWGFDPDTSLTRHHSRFSFYSTISLLSMLFNKPLMLNAIGVGPLIFDIGRKHTIAAFEQASIATVRDEESKELLVSLGLDPLRVKVTADPGYLLNPTPKEVVIPLLEAEGLTLPNERLIGVALRNWDIGIKVDDWLGEVVSALDTMIERYDCTVAFLPFQRIDSHLTDDLAISNLVRARMRNQSRAFVLRGDYTAQQKAGILAQCNAVLGMRLHSIIFAAIAGVPIVSLVYDPKVRNAMRQLGCERYTLDLENMCAAELVKLFDEARENREQISAGIATAVRSLTRLAEENNSLAVGLLEGHGNAEVALSPVVTDLLKQATMSLALRVEEHERALPARIAEIEKIVQSRDEAIEWLSTQVAEQKLSLEAAIVLANEKEHSSESLRAQLTESAKTVQLRDEALATVKNELDESENKLANQIQRVSDLEAQLIEKDDVLRKGAEIIQARDEAIEWLKTELDQSRVNAQRLANSQDILMMELKTTKDAKQGLQEELAAKDLELEKLTNTFWQRMRNRYGRIKYRYLLPVYRLFGHDPQSNRSQRMLK